MRDSIVAIATQYLSFLSFVILIRFQLNEYKARVVRYTNFSPLSFPFHSRGLRNTKMCVNDVDDANRNANFSPSRWNVAAAAKKEEVTDSRLFTLQQTHYRVSKITKINDSEIK